MSGSFHLDSSSNVEIGIEIWLFIHFVGSCRVKKKRTVVDFFLIMQPFLYLEGALKLILQDQF